ncbi:MAG TPA: non-homologous end-joining DNA ligase [Vicinamibacterales bacterium]|jgi:bifunctional non-homologous end joining protein LigD|nr:non-homologous end-joining DNA ligase [Vicinamibacterales bacterium]
MPARVKARFVPPMLLLKTEELPDDRARWLYELKLDGYRAIAFKSDGRLHLRSRNDNDFTRRYAAVVRGLEKLPADTVVDGEIVAFDEEGRPSFNLLQNYDGAGATPLGYFVFDVLVLEGRDVTREPLTTRQALLEQKVLPHLAEPVRYVAPLEGSLQTLVHSVKAHGFEGLVAKRRDSRYESGERSGAWRKMRVNRGQEFVIGGYTPGTRSFDALVIGYYQDGQLLYAARTRNGFTPALRAQVARKFKGLETDVCPFANLPEKKGGRWGEGLTAKKMAECRWLKPVLVGQFEFLEWTADDHLRHTRFVALRDDKDPKRVQRET